MNGVANTHSLIFLSQERASGIEKGVLYQQSRTRQRRRKKVDVGGRARFGTESEGEVSDQPSTPRHGTESEDWFFHSDSESEATVLTALSIVDATAGSPVRQPKMRTPLGTEAMDHLTRESLSTQALWQITGGSSAAGEGGEEHNLSETNVSKGRDRAVAHGDGTGFDVGGNGVNRKATTSAAADSLGDPSKLLPTQQAEIVAAEEVKYGEAVVGMDGQYEMRKCDDDDDDDDDDIVVVGAPTMGLMDGVVCKVGSDAKELKGVLKRRGSESTSWNSQNEVIFENPNSFGSSVSKSFYCETCGHVSNTAICIPKFQIVRNAEDGPNRGEQHAEFLVVVELGAFTFGVWRRYTDFVDLADSIMATDEQKEVYPNSIFSWQCMRFRKRWYKCLDKDYLTVKCFLLERFLHDLVCESTNPTAIFQFIGV